MSCHAHMPFDGVTKKASMSFPSWCVFVVFIGQDVEGFSRVGRGPSPVFRGRPMTKVRVIKLMTGQKMRNCKIWINYIVCIGVETLWTKRERGNSRECLFINNPVFKYSLHALWSYESLINTYDALRCCLWKKYTNKFKYRRYYSVGKHTKL